MAVQFLIISVLVARGNYKETQAYKLNIIKDIGTSNMKCKLTWLVLGGDPAARSHRVEQFTASEACNALGASDGVIHSSIS